MMMGVLLALLCALAGAQYSSRVYRPQGGNSEEVASGGALNVQSGGALNVQSGGALNVAGTLTTSGTLAVGQGTAIAKVLWGTGTLANGQTSGTISLSGFDSTWKVGVECTTAYSNAVYKKYSVKKTGRVDVVYSGDPGTTLTLNAWAWK
jgi:hypothetical protein